MILRLVNTVQPQIDGCQASLTKLRHIQLLFLGSAFEFDRTQSQQIAQCTG